MTKKLTWVEKQHKADATIKKKLKKALEDITYVRNNEHVQIKHISDLSKMIRELEIMISHY